MNLLHNWNKQLFITKNDEKTKFINAFEDKTVWYDAKTSTVKDALELSNSENLFILDEIELMLLIAHEDNKGNITLEHDKGYWHKEEDIILVYRWDNSLNVNTLQPIEGELFAFSLIDEIKLIQIYNEDEYNYINDCNDALHKQRNTDKD